MSGENVSKTEWHRRIRSLVAGTQKHGPSGPLTLGSVTYTATELVQLLEGMADAIDAVEAARASWQDALKRFDDTRAKVAPVIRHYQGWVAVTHGGTPSTLADYGVAPRKAPTPLTAEQKKLAVQRRQATREARHTMGSKQKKAVKGDAVGSTVTSVTAAPPVEGTPVGPVAAIASSPVRP